MVEFTDQELEEMAKSDAEIEREFGQDWQKPSRSCSSDLVLVSRLGAIEDILGADYDLDRLRELVEADREGRCVVLPCKIEDDVYINLLGKTLPFSVISISQMASTPTLKAMNGVRLCYIFKADDVGKTVFLSREAAEQALREE